MHRVSTILYYPYNVHDNYMEETASYRERCKYSVRIKFCISYLAILYLSLN